MSKRKITFKNIDFEVESFAATFGRLGGSSMGIHVKDLGPCPAQFDIVALFLGSDYVRQRNRLLEALRGNKAGFLSDSVYGQFYVLCTTVHVEENQWYKFSRLSIRFVEAEKVAADNLPSFAYFNTLSNTLETYRKAVRSAESMKRAGLHIFSVKDMEIPSFFDYEAYMTSMISVWSQKLDKMDLGALWRGVEAEIGAAEKDFLDRVWDTSAIAADIKKDDKNQKRTFEQLILRHDKIAEVFAPDSRFDSDSFQNKARAYVAYAFTNVNFMRLSHLFGHLRFLSLEEAQNFSGRYQNFVGSLRQTLDGENFERVETIRLACLKEVIRQMETMTATAVQDISQPTSALVLAKAWGMDYQHILDLNAVQDPLLMEGAARYVGGYKGAHV